MASDTGSAQASGGGFSNTGIINGDVHQLSIAPVRNDYHEQVRRIAPLELKDRDAELAELSDFCTRPEVALPYMWWKGDAWVGKSALMSWFVLHPPPDVQVVSFFITGRYASQDDRAAFTENVLEQLAVQVGTQSLPDVSAPTADTRVMGMLSEAALACQARGQRLVLVVDGLDEDRGVMGDQVHSIAALLPRCPVGGMRILVSGRPNPAIPSDVPPGHPLRDPSAGRTLAASPYASVARQEMESALKRLMRGGAIGQDLLGLLTAANGGLSAADLAALTGADRWELAEVLDAVTGRSFATRPSLWNPGRQPDVYLLAHDELRRSAGEFLGPRLGGYRERIHQWAAGFAQRSWPEDTPEYLLRGYAHMLSQQSDQPRLMALAADGARHDRILAASGGDGDALAEIRAALAAAAQEPDPPPGAVACIAYQRDRVEDRNTAIPPELPVAWARLGYFARADALVHSISGGRAWALMEIAAVHAENGAFREASRLRAEAVEMAGEFRSSRPTRRRDGLLTVLAEELARAGDRRLAEEMIGAVHESNREGVTAGVAAGLARSGQSGGGAEAIARSISDVHKRTGALAEVALAFASSGKLQTAMRIADEVLQSESRDGSPVRTDTAFTALRAVARAGDLPRAERLARTFRPVEVRATALAEIGTALIGSDLQNDASRLAADAEAYLYGDRQETSSRADEDEWEEIRDWYRSRALTALARVRAATGEPRQAYRLTTGIEDPAEKVVALAGVAESLAAAGQADSALEMLSAAEALARRNSGAVLQASALVELAWASLDAKQPMLAAEILGDIEAEADGTALAHFPLQRVALALAAAGQVDRSLALAGRIRGLADREKCLKEAACALAKAGEYTKSLELAAQIADQDARAAATLEVVKALAAAGELEQATELAGAMRDQRWRDPAMATCVKAAAVSRKPDLVTALAGVISNHGMGESAVIDAAAILVEGGLEPDESPFLALLDAGKQQQLRAGIAHGIAAAGNVQDALRLAQSVSGPWRTVALCRIADAITEGPGQGDKRAEILREVADSLDGMRESSRPAEGASFADAISAGITARAAAAKSFARAGQGDRAVQIASTITHPGTRRRALQDIALILAETGCTEQAGELAAALTSRRGPTALSAVAVACATREELAASHRFFASAFLSARWTCSAAALGEASPAALNQLASHARSDFRRALNAARPHSDTSTKGQAAHDADHREVR